MKKRARQARGLSRRRHSRPVRFSREVSVLYEDDSVIAINKPAGLLAVPIKGSNAPSALALLSEELKPKRQQALVVHRIDRFASGVLLFAKTGFDRQALVRQFLAHTPLRQYLVVVRGHPPHVDGTLVHYFRRQGMLQKLTTERDPRGTRAELQYSVERPLRGASVVNVTLVTGLQNQIRAQFSEIGNPVIGDRKYGEDEASERRIDRVALHAARLEFVHPRSGKTVVVECDPPTDFRSLLQVLELPARR